MYTQYYNSIYPPPTTQSYPPHTAQYAYGGYPYAAHEQAGGLPQPAPVRYDYGTYAPANDTHRSHVSAGQAGEAAATQQLPTQPPPAATYYENQRQACAPSAAYPPKQTLRRAIEAGYQIFASLPPQAQYELQRRGRKGLSFRKLAAARQMPVSTLWRTLAIYLLFRRYPEIAEYRHLGVGHVSVVLSVQPEHQLYFLRNAEVRGWSRRYLDQAVKQYHAQQGYARQTNYVHQ